jgi:hypothetical protein
LSLPLIRKSATSPMVRPPMSGKPGMRPVPCRTMVMISSRESFLPTPMSDGAAGVPVRSAL